MEVIMKGFHLISLAALLLSVSLFAENRTSTTTIEGKPTTLGVHAGLSVSSADVSAGPSNSTTGILVGGVAQTPLYQDWLFFRPELNFVQQGANNANFGAVADTRLNYLEVPLNVQARYPMEAFTPWVLTGPKISYLLGSSGNAVDKNRLRAVDLGWEFGVGTDIPLRYETKLLVAAKYSLGFLDVDNSAADWKNRSFAVLAGVLF
jgi:hypothetical protein